LTVRNESGSIEKSWPIDWGEFTTMEKGGAGRLRAFTLADFSTQAFKRKRAIGENRGPFYCL
jgi:hypothetical protein